MNARTTAGFLVLLPLFALAGGCNTQKPITFRLNPETGAQKETAPDLGMPAPHLTPTPSRWEYKVMKAGPDGEQELTKFLNELGREGWEFVGQLRTKEAYLVLRRPKLPRDYIRSSGDLTAPDLPDKIATGRMSAPVIPRPPVRPPRDGATSSTRKDTRATGLPRLRERPEG